MEHLTKNILELWINGIEIMTVGERYHLDHCDACRALAQNIFQKAILEQGETVFLRTCREMIYARVL